MATATDLAAHPIDGGKWADAYPAPRERALARHAPQDIVERLESGQKHGVDIVVVDVRRADCKSLIPGAINLPAHSLYQSAPTLVHLLAPVKLVVFHCNRSNGRGPRAAGWYADALQQHLGIDDDEVATRVGIVVGGIVAWEETYGMGPMAERGTRRGASDAGDSTIQL